MERYPALFVSCRLFEHADPETLSIHRDRLAQLGREAVASGTRLLAVVPCGDAGCDACGRVRFLKDLRQPGWGDPVVPLAEVVSLDGGDGGVEAIRDVALRLNIDLRRSTMLSHNGELAEAARRSGIPTVEHLDLRAGLRDRAA